MKKPYKVPKIKRPPRLSKVKGKTTVAGVLKKKY